MLTDRKRKALQDKYMRLLTNIDREGIGKLITFLLAEGINDCPASIKFHQNYRTGLIEHSIGVYDILCKEVKNHKLNTPHESIVLVSLLHDICKLDNYVVDDFSSCGFTYNPGPVIKGHGDKSVSLVKTFMDLTEEEELAIRYHMGIYSGDYSWDEFGDAIKRYPLVYLAHVADMKDSYNIR